MNKNSHIISLLVNNNSGVLSRISALFARRGYNIESLSVCATEDDSYSRMTVTASGDEQILSQITKQLKKLVDVVYINELEPEDSVSRELLLIKVSAPQEARTGIIEVANVYKASIIELAPLSIILEITGEPGKLDAFISVIQAYGIIEMARSGASSLHRGTTCIKDYLKDKNDK